VNAIAVNKLIAGDALFAGQATFSYQDPVTSAIKGRVTINASGLTLADAYPTPNSTVTIASTGVTVSRGSYTVSVTASGISISEPGGASLILTSGILSISRGSNSVVITSNGVTITGPNGSVTANASGVTIIGGVLSSPTITGGSLSIVSGNTTVAINGTVSIRVTSTLFGNYASLEAGAVAIQSSFDSSRAQMYLSGSSGRIKLQDSGSNAVEYLAGTATSANSGAATLPSNPVGFVFVVVNGLTRKIPFYQF
jgi:hypothetical protein